VGAAILYRNSIQMLAASCMPGAGRERRPFTAAEWGAAARAAYQLAADYSVPLAGLQIFTTGPASYQPLFADATVFAALRAVSAEMRPRGRFLVHGHYLTATVWDLGRAAGGPLSGTRLRAAPRDQLTPGQRIVSCARQHLAGQLHAATGFAAEGVVVHLPSLPPTPLVECVSDVVARCRDFGRGAAPPRLWLETAAELPRTEWGYSTAPQIAALVSALDDLSLLPRAGICIDTAHIWSQGNDAVVKYDDFVELLRPAREAADNPLPLMIHLNDCTLARGVGRDIHAALGAGLIWPDFAQHPAATGAAAALDLARELKGLAVLERSNAAALADDYAALRKYPW
jgi:sugar phosphate isomerase/epimerase